MKQINKRRICLLLALVLLMSLVPQFTLFVNALEADAVSNEFAGKTVSILGDSISTFSGVSNNEISNSTIGSNAVYYSGQGGITRADTWWQQVIDVLDMELLVNNSWSGSCVFQPRQGEASVGYTDRCINLHNDHTGEEPDIILVFLGTNDYKNYLSTVGTEVDVDYDAMIAENGDGTYVYATPSTTCEAYAIMLHKMSVRYPDAEIYCLSLLPRNKGPAALTKFNQDIAVMAERFGCSFVDLEHCGITPDAASLEKYMFDGKVHPNNEGMDLMSQAVVSALTGNQSVIRDVEMMLANATADKAVHACIEGNAFKAKLTSINPNEKMTVSITMGGEDITDAVYDHGSIFIENVTGDVKIVASAERGNVIFRWEYSDGELVNTVGEKYAENVLLKQRGSSADGVFEDTYYRTQHTVKLLHDKPWILEWKGSGSGGFMLSDATSSGSSTVYFRRHTNGYLHVFGAYDGSRYNHYGVKPGDYGIDVKAVHTYRMENRINADGSNMVYFFVDGVEIGAMNNYYVGYVSQGTTDNWISGKDFNINYIGSSTHPLDAYSMEYLQIWEGGELSGPVITQQPENVQQEIGKKFAVTVKAEGEGLTYQWYVKEAGAKAFKESANKTASYAYTMQTYMHNRQVYCVITDAYGNQVTTETATITRPPQALKITAQPQSVQVNIGEQFSISPKVEGEGLTYQWYVKESGAKTFKVSNNKTSAYAYTMQSYMKGRQVYCVITDKYGNEVTTDVATISLPPVELKLLSQPTDVSAFLGEKFSISFDVQGDGLTYQWYVKESGAKTFKVSSNKTSAYAYSMQSYMNNRQVYCVIADKYGNEVTTEVVTIHVEK